MTVQAYSDILETAAGSNGYIFGYDWDVNKNVKLTFPLVRAYPFNWGLPRSESFTISQSFFIYVKNENKVTGWDAAIAVWETFKGNLTGNVEVTEVTAAQIHYYGFTIEQAVVLEVTANVKIYC